ncbi:AAA family ATPase [Streptomyces sp. NPDC079020]|uniref:AAA family ATPase n=1 Tax=Streptomyces sp. NPDC079020 TaxID=3365722 RepID=UPI0037D5D327
MQFRVVRWESELPVGYDGAYLIPDNWNDYGFVTTFELGIQRPGAKPVSIGGVRIAHQDMARNPGDEFWRTNERLPQQFDALGEEYFSLGMRDTYYEALNELADETRSTILTSLRDLAHDYSADLLDRVRDLRVYRKSLLRDVTHRDAELERLHLIARGRRRVVDFHWSYTPTTPAGSHHDPSTLDFHASPTSLPPTNVHALIGRNGVGKTSMMRGMALGVAGGEIEVAQSAAQTAKFAPNVVLVSFSAFDDLLNDPVPSPHFTYIGLRDGSDPRRLKTGADLSEEFANSLAIARVGARRERWEKVIRTLSYPESGFLDDFDGDLDSLLTEGSDSRFRAAAISLFAPLSSGHKIALLTLTRLITEVAERTVVFIDEPEAHLQPPLLSAFVRALSDFLSDLNGMAVVATHSPVVLQEVPASCVYKLRRYGDVLTAERPQVETYGENVSELTHEAFGLEVTATGFYAALADLAERGLSYQEIVERFDSLGTEARGLLRVMTLRRDSAAS